MASTQRMSTCCWPGSFPASRRSASSGPNVLPRRAARSQPRPQRLRRRHNRLPRRRPRRRAPQRSQLSRRLRPRRPCEEGPCEGSGQEGTCEEGSGQEGTCEEGSGQEGTCKEGSGKEGGSRKVALRSEGGPNFGAGPHYVSTVLLIAEAVDLLLELRALLWVPDAEAFLGREAKDADLALVLVLMNLERGFTCVRQRKCLR